MVSKKASGVSPSPTLAIDTKFKEMKANGEDVVGFGCGEPDFDTPNHIKKAAIDAIMDGETKYTPASGTLRLRKAVADKFLRENGLSYAPSDIVVSNGAKHSLVNAFMAICNPGDEVIIPQPSYVCYEPITKLVGGVPVIIETLAENDFKVTPEQLKNAISEKTKALILPYPCNPTGAIMEKADLEAISKILRDTNIVVISDEIYSELTFADSEHVSIASIDGMRERTILINGFSKAFSMTGWRLGFACGPQEIISQITKIHQFAIMCAPTTAQYAAIEALRNCDEAVANMKAEYNRRRRLIVEGFNKAGLTCREPKGAFYAFPCIKSTGLTSEEFCERLLQKKHVAVVPGTAFGKGGEGFVRASYCYSPEHIIEALRRIDEFVKEIAK